MSVGVVTMYIKKLASIFGFLLLAGITNADDAASRTPIRNSPISEQERNELLKSFADAVKSPAGSSDSSAIVDADDPTKIENKLQALDAQATLSVLVSATPPSHRDSVLRRISDMKARKSISIEKVVVFGSHVEPNEFIAKEVQRGVTTERLSSGVQGLSPSDINKEVGRYFKDLLSKAYEENYTPAQQEFNGYFSRAGYINGSDLVKRYGVSLSPTWIVHQNGTDSVYEGDYAIEDMVSSGVDLTTSAFADDTEKLFHVWLLKGTGRTIKHFPKKDGIPFGSSEAQLFMRPHVSNFADVEKVNGRNPLEPSIANQLPYLPNCGAAQTRRLTVSTYSPLSDTYDYLFFSATDNAQIQRAASQPASMKLVPYESRASTATMSAESAAASLLAPALYVACLPTRFHFVTDGGKRFIEYREGTNAWEDSSP